MLRFVLCVVASWLMSSYSTPARADNAEDKAVAFFKELGGNADRNENLPGKPVVSMLFFSNAKVTDADLKALAAFKNLTTLILSDIKITDAGLRELAPLKNLTRLDLS